MTTKAAFTEQEWDLVRAAPPSAGMIVITAARGGTMRETFEMAQVYGDTRRQHGESELLDELVSAKPAVDHTRHHSFEELKEHGLQRLRDAVALLETKAAADEVNDYREFILTLTRRVAERHKEGDAQVSPGEQQAIDEVAAALGIAPS
jgi:hypothetical protein